jgi:serine/threonine-protein kinase
MVLHGGAAAGRYLRGQVLGSGSTATVYQAHDQLLDRPVALKVIHLPDMQTVLLAEARAAAGISHQNVVTIHDVVEDANGPFIAMELVEGPTLAEVLASGPMPTHAALRTATDVAAALEAAHRRGVVHCDIKPDNVFVTHAGRTVVTDFGLAAPELGGGTPGYMAPEQYHDAPPTPAMDVFAWGCLTAELLGGVPPFGIEPADAELRTQVDAPSLALEAFEPVPGLLDLVLRSLEKDPSSRPPDGGALLSELAVVLGMTQSMTVPTVREGVPALVDPPQTWESGLTSSVVAPVWSQARLVIATAGDPPWVAALQAGEAIEVGREAAIRLSDPQASRRHALLWFDGTHLQITDLGSMNGTYWNGQPVSHCFAVPGDVISIGSTLITIEGGY